MSAIHDTLLVFIRVGLTVGKIALALGLFLGVFFGLLTIPAPMMIAFFALLISFHVIQRRFV